MGTVETGVAQTVSGAVPEAVPGVARAAAMTPVALARAVTTASGAWMAPLGMEAEPCVSPSGSHPELDIRIRQLHHSAPHAPFPVSGRHFCGDEFVNDAASVPVHGVQHPHSPPLAAIA